MLLYNIAILSIKADSNIKSKKTTNNNQIDLKTYHLVGKLLSCIQHKTKYIICSGIAKQL